MTDRPEVVPGPVGNALANFLAEAIHTGGLSLVDVVRHVVESILFGERREVVESPVAIANMFQKPEIVAVSNVLSQSIGTAELVGALRVHEALGLVSPSEFRGIVSELAPLPPQQAIEYFSSLVPQLGRNPDRSEVDLRRRAFTVAVSTTEEMTSRIQSAIQRELHEGWDSDDAVQSILDDAGVSTANPQYVNMVVRTNVMDAYNQGQWDEANSSDEFQQQFPAWEYHAIRDSRSRPEHARRDGLFWPSAIPFVQVRGTEPKDVCNCRCNFSWLTRRQWEQARAKGASLEW